MHPKVDWILFLLCDYEANAGNGGSGEGYSWTQTMKDVNITVPVPRGTFCGKLRVW